MKAHDGHVCHRHLFEYYWRKNLYSCILRIHSPRPRSSFESARVPRSTDSRPPPIVERSSTTPGSRCRSLSGSPSACSAPSSPWAPASSSSDWPRPGSSSSCTSPARPPEIGEFLHFEYQVKGNLSNIRN